MLQHVAFVGVMEVRAFVGGRKNDSGGQCFFTKLWQDCCPKCVLIEEKSNILNISFSLPCCCLGEIGTVRYRVKLGLVSVAVHFWVLGSVLLARRILLRKEECSKHSMHNFFQRELALENHRLIWSARSTKSDNTFFIGHSFFTIIRYTPNIYLLYL
jgi:hypothetical protein